MMIEVFKTNVQDTGRSAQLIGLLLQHFPVCRINFDLEDCDKVLRIEGSSFCARRIIKLLNKTGTIAKYLHKPLYLITHKKNQVCQKLMPTSILKRIAPRQ